jgi:hypothetical protein
LEGELVGSLSVCGIDGHMLGGDASILDDGKMLLGGAAFVMRRRLAAIMTRSRRRRLLLARSPVDAAGRVHHTGSAANSSSEPISSE